jgi:hypothetical protein
MNLVEVMFGELEVTSNPEGQGLIESLVDATKEAPPNESPEDAKRRKARQSALLAKVLALPDRVDTLKKLLETQDRAIQLERQAFGIGKDDHGEEGSEAGGKILSDSDRASRTAALIELAMKRRADAQLAQPQTATDAA